MSRMADRILARLHGRQPPIAAAARPTVTQAKERMQLEGALRDTPLDVVKRFPYRSMAAALVLGVAAGRFPRVRRLVIKGSLLSLRSLGDIAATFAGEMTSRRK